VPVSSIAKRISPKKRHGQFGRKVPLDLFSLPHFKLQKSSSNPFKQKEKQEDLCTHNSQIIKISGGKKEEEVSFAAKEPFSNEIAKNKKKTRQAKNRERII
jgi:hypothetical protein